MDKYDKKYLFKRAKELLKEGYDWSNALKQAHKEMKQGEIKMFKKKEENNNNFVDIDIQQPIQQQSLDVRQQLSQITQTITGQIQSNTNQIITNLMQSLEDDRKQLKIIEDNINTILNANKLLKYFYNHSVNSRQVLLRKIQVEEAYLNQIQKT